MPNQPASFQDPAWLWGRSLSDRTMIRALARCLGAEQQWREEAQQQLTALRDNVLMSGAPESALIAIDEALSWISAEVRP